jgi:hypothetical protein
MALLQQEIYLVKGKQLSMYIFHEYICLLLGIQTCLDCHMHHFCISDQIS